MDYQVTISNFANQTIMLPTTLSVACEECEVSMSQNKKYNTSEKPASVKLHPLNKKPILPLLLTSLPKLNQKVENVD